MPTTLEQIMAATLLRVRERKANANLNRLESLAAAHRPRGFAARVREVARQGPAVIAELKRASPSKGLLRDDYRPVSIAKAYAAAGAAAISVLTEEEFFLGSLEHLEDVSRAVSIPVLRKDFILDPFQILEARAAGADAILLIVAALSDAELNDLAKEAFRMHLDVLCEVHDREDVRRAADLGCEMIGVNSRDLKSMAVRPETHRDIFPYLPATRLAVAESGIRTPEDIERLTAVGYDAFLVGEAFMRQPDPAASLALMIGRDYATEF
jgi:indole-3-glycerol phosphate synthase